MQIAGIGRVIFWEGGSLWIGLAVGPSELHAHHAIQLGVGLSGRVQFKRAGGLPWTHYAAAVIPSNLQHTFRAPGTQVANIFVEPESAIGRGLVERFGSSEIAGLQDTETRALSGPLAHLYNNGAEDQDLRELAQRTMAKVAGEAVGSATTDARVLKAIREIIQGLDEPLTLSAVARAAGLSEGRLRHLFVAETGVPFRQYVLWARLNRALELGFGGASWTEAAHAAAFSDSAHLTRTCRRMFGLTPTAIRHDETLQSDRMLA